MGKKVRIEEPAPETRSRFVTKQKDALDIKRYESVATLSAMVNAFCLAGLPSGIDWEATLMRNPVETLLVASAGTLVMQFYAGMHFRAWWNKEESGSDVTQEEREAEEAAAHKDRWALSKLSGASLEPLFQGLGLTLAGAVLLHFTMILFGAPIISKAFVTFLASLYISILAFFPLAFSLTAPYKSLAARQTYIRLFCALSPQSSTEKALLYPCIGTLAGAWFGAFPLPLDWDAPWQRWPTTVCWVALLGSILGNAVSALTMGWNAVSKEEVPVVQKGKKNK